MGQQMGGEKYFLFRSPKKRSEEEAGEAYLKLFEPLLVQFAQEKGLNYGFRKEEISYRRLENYDEHFKTNDPADHLYRSLLIQPSPEHNLIAIVAYAWEDRQNINYSFHLDYAVPINLLLPCLNQAYQKLFSWTSKDLVESFEQK